jgi:hypothetical protein
MLLNSRLRTSFSAPVDTIAPSWAASYGANKGPSSRHFTSALGATHAECTHITERQRTSRTCDISVKQNERNTDTSAVQNSMISFPRRTITRFFNSLTARFYALLQALLALYTRTIFLTFYSPFEVPLGSRCESPLPIFS